MKTSYLIFLISTLLISSSAKSFDLKNKTIKMVENNTRIFSEITKCKNKEFVIKNVFNNGETRIFSKEGFDTCHVVFYNDYITQCQFNESDLKSIYQEQKNNELIVKEKVKNMKPVEAHDLSHFEFNRLLNSDKCTIKNLPSTFLKDTYISENFKNKTHDYLISKSTFDNNLYECINSEKSLFNPLINQYPYLKIRKINSNLCSYQITTDNNSIDCLFNMDEQYNVFITKHINQQIKDAKNIKSATNGFHIKPDFELLKQINQKNCIIKRNL